MKKPSKYKLIIKLTLVFITGIIVRIDQTRIVSQSSLQMTTKAATTHISTSKMPSHQLIMKMLTLLYLQKLSLQQSRRISLPASNSKLRVKIKTKCRPQACLKTVLKPKRATLERKLTLLNVSNSGF